MEKNKEYYENLDQRTKEFKEWKMNSGLQPHVPATTEELQAHADKYIEEVTQEKLDAKYKESQGIGLGDAVAGAMKFIGVKQVVDYFTPEGDDCGCSERQAKLNKHKIFKGWSAKKMVNCLTVDEYKFLSVLLKENKTITRIDQNKMLVIYHRVFNLKPNSSCTSCSISKKIDELKAILTTYE